MTAIGKMLVIFNFMLACFMTFLVVQLWGSVKNWKAEAKRVADVAADNYKGAEDARKRYDEERERANSAIAQARADADRFRIEREEFAKQNKLQKDAYDNKLAQERKSEASNIAYQITIKSLQDTNDTLNVQLKSSEKARDDLTLVAKANEVQRDDARRERDSFHQQVDRLKDQLKDLADRYADLQQGGKSLSGSPLAPENFRGTVREFKEDFVEITPGLNAGLRPGTKLMIRRVEDGGKFIGYLVIGDTVNPDKAVGRWVKPGNLVKMTAADLPRKGDEVVPAK